MPEKIDFSVGMENAKVRVANLNFAVLSKFIELPQNSKLKVTQKT